MMVQVTLLTDLMIFLPMTSPTEKPGFSSRVIRSIVSVGLVFLWGFSPSNESGDSLRVLVSIVSKNGISNWSWKCSPSNESGDSLELMTWRWYTWLAWLLRLQKSYRLSVCRGCLIHTTWCYLCFVRCWSFYFVRWLDVVGLCLVELIVLMSLIGIIFPRASTRWLEVSTISWLAFNSPLFWRILSTYCKSRLFVVEGVDRLLVVAKLTFLVFLLLNGFVCTFWSSKFL